MKKNILTLIIALSGCLFGTPGILKSAQDGYIRVEAEDATSIGGVNTSGDRLSYINNNDWAGYNQISLSSVEDIFRARLFSKFGGEIQIKDGLNGPIIATCIIPITGNSGNNPADWDIVSCVIDPLYTNSNDIHLVFKANGAYACELDWIEFSSSAFYIEAEEASDWHNVQKNQNTNDPQGGGKQISHVKNGSWAAYEGVGFSGQTYFKARTAAGNSGWITVRLNSEGGPIVGSYRVPKTGWSNWVNVEGELFVPINGEQDIYLVFTSENGHNGWLFNLNKFEFSMDTEASGPASTGINVYPEVPHGNESTLEYKSEYYTFEIQETSKLNHSNKANATNWESAFPWFTKCQPKNYYGSESEQYDGNGNPDNAYFNQIENWTHTYCNFEMAPNTEVVIKITRQDPDGGDPNGFQGGPVSNFDEDKISVRPASAGATVEVINGDVYVTMSNPALITVDFENGLDQNHAPQSNPWVRTGNLNGNGIYKDYPYTNENNAMHVVSIFANAFIDDKPDPQDPSVYVLEPGAPIPAYDETWRTLYFEPGVHKLSLDTNGQEREWRPSDVLSLAENTSYYIPGDAIVYGNFKDENGLGNTPTDNVRVFGHGTLSGLKIKHFDDWSDALTDDSNFEIDDKYINIDEDGKRRVEHKYLRMLELRSSMNCTYEGLTIADQPEHGVYINGRPEVGDSNYIKWIKTISWRVNTDGMSIHGNSYIEDCFIRVQDDGTYVAGMGIKDVVFWSDVNGTSLRCSNLAYDRGDSWPDALLNQDLVVENIDVIYTRGGAYGSTGAIISNGPDARGGKSYNGQQNTAQHVVFKNITVEDPRPVRGLFDFDIKKASGPQTNGSYYTAASFKYLTFENINYENQNVAGIINRLHGNGNTNNLSHWTFDNVVINNDSLGSNDMNDPSEFDIQSINVSSMNFY